MDAKGKERWEQATYQPAIEAQPERAAFASEAGEPTAPLYDTPGDAARIGYPGEFPFTRGVHPSMYRSRLWTMRQYAGYSTPAETNTRFRRLLAEGQTGLSIAFDLPTQIGYDPDHALAQEEIGKVGVSVSSIVDMEELLADIPLDAVTTSMTINATAPILLALYLAVARRRGVPLSLVGGTVQNDVLKEYIARGTYAFPPAGSMRLATDLFRYCIEHTPRWNPISVSGYHMREAGATADQEVGFTLANAVAYVRAGVDAGIDLDALLPRVSFFFAAHNDLLEEAAKFRAARRLWARITRERLGAKEPRSWALRFHTQTAGVTLTAQQPEVNTVRTTVQALAAVLGGTQSLHVNARDEAIGLPTEESATLALRAQQVLAAESGVATTVDPLGGSYYVEHLTNEIERRAEAYIDHAEQLGGAVAAIEAGYPQAQIEEAAYRHQRAVERGERTVVGVNAYVEASEPPWRALALDPRIAAAQIERVQRVRAQRDGAIAARALARLGDAAAGDGDTMSAILECVESFATLGEIAAVLRDALGEHTPMRP